MTYVPICQTHPSEVRDVECWFFYEEEWSPSEAAIQRAANEERLQRIGDDSINYDDYGEPYQALLKATIYHAVTNVKDFVEGIRGYKSLRDYFDFLDCDGLQPLGKHTLSYRKEKIHAVGQDVAWLLDDCDRPALNFTLEECCLAENAEVDTEFVMEQIRNTIQSWLLSSPVSIEALRWYVNESNKCV